MKAAFTGASLSVLLSAAAFGQAAPEAPPKFEVASVKPAVWRTAAPGSAGQRTGGFGGGGRGGCPTSLKMDAGRVDIRCATLPMLMGYAYRFAPDRITGPDWMMALGSPRFDIVAKIPQGASEHQVPEMLQALLADRFLLGIHRASATRSIYALVVAKGGLKLTEAAPEAAAKVPAADPNVVPGVDGFYGGTEDHTTTNADGTESTTIGNPRMGAVRQTGDPYKMQRWEAPSISLAGLADLLDKVAPLSTPVIDMTGLPGRYRMVLEVSLRDARPEVVSAIGDPAAGDSRRTDMEEAVVRSFNDGLVKLGLRLERRKGPVDTIVVDRVEKSPAGN